MTPDPVDLVTVVLLEQGHDIERAEVMAALNALRSEDLDIVRFAVGYLDPRDPTATCGGCGRRPPMPVVVERWPGDDSHKGPERAQARRRRSAAPVAVGEQLATPEGKVVDLMAALERSVRDAKADRARRKAGSS